MVTSEAAGASSAMVKLIVTVLLLTSVTDAGSLIVMFGPPAAAALTAAVMAVPQAQGSRELRQPPVRQRGREGVRRGFGAGQREDFRLDPQPSREVPLVPDVEVGVRVRLKIPPRHVADRRQQPRPRVGRERVRRLKIWAASLR